MKKLILLFLLLTISTISIGQTIGTPSVNQSISITIRNVLDVSLTNTNAQSFVFDNIEDYETGIEVLNANTVHYRANKSWIVSVKALATFSGSGDVPPLSILKVRKSGETNYLNLSSTAQQIATGTKGNNTFTIDYKVVPTFNYSEGAYSTTLEYTLTNQ